MLNNKKYSVFFKGDSGTHFVRPMLMAIFVGVGTGFLVVGFVKSVALVRDFCFNPAIRHSPFVILVPAFAGLLIGPLVTFFAPEAKGHGIPEILKAVALRGGKIRPGIVFYKAVASVLSIGSGFSVGREGPIAQIGAAFGSAFGQVLKLPSSRVINLTACGVAAGIAGVFNTPIAGVMFASEVILRDFGSNVLTTIVVAAVSSSIISRIFLGDHPSFSVPTYTLHNPIEIFLYFGLGILAALAAVLFMTVLEKLEILIERWKFPEWLKPVCGGVLIGIIGYVFPQIFGSGLPTIEDALHGNLSLQLLLSLIILKIFATSLSLGAGSSGGVFAPLLFIGAVLGGAFGQLVSMYYFIPIAPSGAYALVGMASVFAAAARAPITAILIVFELTGGYGMILPIMIGVVTATSISQLILKDSIYLGKLKRKGIDIKSFEETRVLEGLRVSDVATQEFKTIRQDAPAKELFDHMAKDLYKIVFVLDKKGNIRGIIRPADLNKALLADGEDILNVYDIASPVKEYSFPDESLSEAVKIMAAHHLTELPVVDSLDSTKIIGVLKSEDVFRVYAEYASKRGEILTQLEQEQVSPDMITIVFTISNLSPAAGKLIKDLNLPGGVHFNVIKRGLRSFVPHGNLTMKPKDRVTAVVAPENESYFRQWLFDMKLKNS
ncbi:MAG: chloride channel protein [Candidatus Omnitrophica bacterium]|nr:chloride channel protein [Candidatus Omnitrophota bacterium]